jgi:putative transcriptional regulator
MIESQIAPGLLIAMPALLDPNFARAVILMVDHSPGGSFGLVLNRPLELKVPQMLAGVGITWAGDDADVGCGGPVETGSLWLLHEPVGGVPEPESSREIVPGVVLSAAAAAVRHLSGLPLRRRRYLLGYSGWGVGQLQREMMAGSWLHAEASPGLVFDTPAERVWETALRGMGLEPGALAQGGALS